MQGQSQPEYALTEEQPSSSNNDTSSSPSQASPPLNNLTSMIKISDATLGKFALPDVRQLVEIGIRFVRLLGECEILQHIQIEGTNLPTQYLKIGPLLTRIDDRTFVIAEFEDIVAFLFENRENQNELYVISAQFSNVNLNHFISVMKYKYYDFRQATHSVRYRSDEYENLNQIKKKVNLIVGEQLTQETVQDLTSGFGSILKSVGSMVGSVAKNAQEPSAKAEVILQNTVRTVSQRFVSDENRGRWNMVKEKASNINQKMTEYYKPIDEKVQNLITTVGAAFNNSQNTYIKSIKSKIQPQDHLDFGKYTANTLNKSYKKAESTFMNQNQGTANNAPVEGLHENSMNNLNQGYPALEEPATNNAEN